jgi:hypothetical protein
MWERASDLSKPLPAQGFEATGGDGMQLEGELGESKRK